MNQLAMKIRKALENSNYSDSQRTTFTAFALAQSLAYGLPIPSSAVGSVRSYFNTQYTAEVGKLVSEFNEHFVVPVGMVMEMARALYDIRYRLVHEADTDATLRLMMGCAECELPAELAQLSAQNNRDDMLMLNWMLRDFRQAAVFQQANSQVA